MHVTGSCDMVRNYKRVSTRASYSQEAMLAALSDVRQEKLSVNEATQQYGIPRPTIIKRLKKPYGYQPSSLGRFKPVFSLDFEAELWYLGDGLAQHCISADVGKWDRAPFLTCREASRC